MKRDGGGDVEDSPFFEEVQFEASALFVEAQLENLLVLNAELNRVELFSLV